ncbi:hypothetical protein IFO70_32850 [Phormidium tenue FACHB-886]|nr:hypothetical protein [Phormidium tenue FACHB-886]
MDLNQIEKLVAHQERKKQLATFQQQQQPIAQDGKVLNADLSPEAGASHAMAFVRSHGKAGTNPAERVGEILEQVEAVKAGDLSNLEGMLYSQSLTLQTIFNQLTALGSSMLTNAQSENAIALLHVALKSQNQCRQTLLALNELKNPKKPTQFIKNYVDRQVNQLKVEGQQQLDLEASPYAEMDPRSATEAVGTDSPVATVAAIDRSDDTGRKAAKQSKRAKARDAIGTDAGGQ